MRSPFIERLQRGPILSDGAIGTLLYERGVPYGRCFDELNLTEPELVSSVHRDYLAAGAEMLTTNTFGANCIRLAEFGLEKKTRNINLRGVKIAREAREVSGRAAFVAGSVGPIHRSLAEDIRGRSELLRSAYREQIEALLEGGADVISFETFSDLDELLLAIQTCREVCDLPIIAQMTFGEDGLTLAGQTPEQVAAQLAPRAEVIGVNCSVGPQGVLDVVQHMRSTASTPIIVQPNAGLPARRGEHFLYISGPQYFAEYAERFLAAGAGIVGGCCGTTPAHIAAMESVLGLPARAAPPVPVQPVHTDPPVELTEAQPPTRLASAIQAGEFLVSVELDPPKGLNPTKVLDGARMLASRGVQFVNVADSPMARVRMGCLAVAKLIQEQTPLETIVHFTTRDRNVMALQSDLIGAHAMGIRNVLALTGDPPTLGDYPDATGVWDIDSVGLIETLKKLNSGADRAGRSVGSRAGFCVGAAVNPTAEDTELEIERLWSKLGAGADFIMSQPLYDLDTLHWFLDRLGPLPVPFLLGVLPLQSFKHADYMHNEVPGITVPQHVLDAMRAAGPNGIHQGMLLAQEFVNQAQSRVQGIYLMPSFGRYEVCAEVIDALDCTRRPEGSTVAAGS